MSVVATRIFPRRRESGAAAVEFALVSLLLVTILFGILQYGFYFWARSSASAAVREGARRVSVGDYPSCSDLQSFVENELGAARGNSSVSTTRTFANGTGNTNPATEVGDIMTLRVEFDSLDVGFLPLPLGGEVQAEAISRIESVKNSPPGAC